MQFVTWPCADRWSRNNVVTEVATAADGLFGWPPTTTRFRAGHKFSF